MIAYLRWRWARTLHRYRIWLDQPPRQRCVYCGRRWSGQHTCGGVWQRETTDPGSKRPPPPPPPPPQGRAR